jgi:hypothetical protein
MKQLTSIRLLIVPEILGRYRASACKLNDRICEAAGTIVTQALM